VLLRNAGIVDTFFVGLFTKRGIIAMFLKRRDAFHAREMIVNGLEKGKRVLWCTFVMIVMSSV
jgi:hypothetical protein